MVEVTLKFDYPTAEAFWQSHIWQRISELILHKACISFRVEEEVAE